MGRGGGERFSVPLVPATALGGRQRRHKNGKCQEVEFGSAFRDVICWMFVGLEGASSWF